MASLNTLRTKFGVVLSIVIGVALLAFILSLKTEMGFSGNDPKVGEIYGEKIKYSEYLTAYDQAKMMMGGEASTDEQLDQLSNAAWQQLFAELVLTPGFEKLGIIVPDAERKAIISGEIPTQSLYAAFGDPRTNTYNLEAVADFLAQAETNPQVATAWNRFVEQAMQEREVAKYLAVVKNGVNVSAPEVERGVAAANRSYTGKFVSKSYASVPDSLFTVSSADLKAYYKSHKDLYKQLPNRTISYVVFNVEATSDDMLAIEKEVNKANELFSTTNDLKAFARENRHALVSDRYLSVKQFSDEEAEALADNKQYGPVLKNNVWTMSRVLDSKMAPDSIGVRHVAFPYTASELADSIATVLRSGVSFQEASEGSGEERVYPFAAFTEEFVPSLLSAKVGDVVEVTAGNAIHVMQIYRMDKPSKHIRPVTVTYPVEASSATKRDIHGKAGVLAVDGAGSVEKFNAAASAAAVTPRVATINQGDRSIRGLENSREIVRWASDASKGEISEIFNVGNDYVVAILTDIDNDEYASIQKRQAQIRSAVLRDKKYDYIVKELSVNNLEEAAKALDSEVKEFSDIRYGSFYAQNLGFEPRVIGAITTGTDFALVKGNSGVFFIAVDEPAAQNEADEQALKDEKVRAQATAENMALQASFAAIQQMAEVEDLRAKYF